MLILAGAKLWAACPLQSLKGNQPKGGTQQGTWAFSAQAEEQQLCAEETGKAAAPTDRPGRFIVLQLPDREGHLQFPFRG